MPDLNALNVIRMRGGSVLYCDKTGLGIINGEEAYDMSSLVNEGYLAHSLQLSKQDLSKQDRRRGMAIYALTEKAMTALHENEDRLDEKPTQNTPEWQNQSHPARRPDLEEVDGFNQQKLIVLAKNLAIECKAQQLDHAVFDCAGLYVVISTDKNLADIYANIGVNSVPTEDSDDYEVRPKGEYQRPSEEETKAVEEGVTSDEEKDEGSSPAV